MSDNSAKEQPQPETSNAKDQAIAQAQSIVAYVAALNVDYDRLEELRDEKENFESDEIGNLASPDVHKIVWEQTNPDEAEELVQLEADAGDCKYADQAREAIQNDALEVQVRSDWHSPGHDTEHSPSEFYILLCTGGPAVRIMGELNDNLQPSRAWIEYQDWGTPWTQLFGEIGQQDLIEYCQCFYFGE